MINTETLKFIGVLNQLADKSKDGIHAFSEATNEQFSDGIVYDDVSGDFAVIADVDINDKTIVSTYNDIYGVQGIRMRACVQDDDAWIEVSFKDDFSCVLAIHDGKWYAC